MNYRKLIKRVIGRELLPTEVVHHINGDHKDNRIDNFYIFDKRGKHVVHHILVGTVAMRLANCYTNEAILKLVRERIIPMLKKSNINDLMTDNHQN